jgi:hypothetical protein
MVDLENHIVEVDDVMARLYFKRKVRVPLRGVSFHLQPVEDGTDTVFRNVGF